LARYLQYLPCYTPKSSYTQKQQHNPSLNKNNKQANNKNKKKYQHPLKPPFRRLFFGGFFFRAGIAFRRATVIVTPCQGYLT